MIVVLAIAAAVGWYLYTRGTEDTDDAQIDGHLVPIASRIDGTIQAVRVEDNQQVKAGELLVELDPDMILVPDRDEMGYSSDRRSQS